MRLRGHKTGGVLAKGENEERDMSVCMDAGVTYCETALIVDSRPDKIIFWLFYYIVVLYKNSTLDSIYLP